MWKTIILLASLLALTRSKVSAQNVDAGAIGYRGTTPTVFDSPVVRGMTRGAVLAVGGRPDIYLGRDIWVYVKCHIGRDAVGDACVLIGFHGEQVTYIKAVRPSVVQSLVASGRFAVISSDLSTLLPSERRVGSQLNYLPVNPQVQKGK